MEIRLIGSHDAESGNIITTAADVSAFEAAVRSDASAVAAADAASAERARLTAILTNPKMRGRERAAIELAVRSPGMAPDDVTEFVEANIPVATANSFARREGETGADQVPATPDASHTPATAAHQPEAKVEGSGWQSAVAKLNRQIVRVDRRN